MAVILWTGQSKYSELTFKDIKTDKEALNALIKQNIVPSFQTVSWHMVLRWYFLIFIDNYLRHSRIE